MMNNEKSYLRMGAIIGVIIGVILMIITLSINHSNAGILTGVFCLLVSGILGIVIGSIIQKKNDKTTDLDEQKEDKQVADEKLAEEEPASEDATGKPAVYEEAEDKSTGKEEPISVDKTEKTVLDKEVEEETEEEPASEEATGESAVYEEAEDKPTGKEEPISVDKTEKTALDKEVEEETEEEPASEEATGEPAVYEEVEDKSAGKEGQVKTEKKDESPVSEPKQEDNAEEPELETKGGFFSRLVAGLTKTRNSLNESFNNLFSGFSSIDDDFYDELEETLIMADLGLDTTEKIIDNLKDLVKKNHIKEASECKELVINIIKDQMLVEDEAYDFEDKKTVMLIIGVNGVGKTTSIGKLASQYKKRGKKVMMCAADTFRAAAIDQLKTWANRAGVEIIAQDEGADPAAVTFDAVSAAKARGVDILLVDTAGRLHNKKNLMDELAKMKRIIEKEDPDAHLETLIVLDGSTGQNALEQARQFSNVTQIDGIILTKLDGTAKGGIAIAIQAELNVPVKYIGVGEQINDLQKFDPDAYVNALFADMDTRSDIEILIPED